VTVSRIEPYENRRAIAGFFFGYWQTVPGVTKTCRVIGFEPVTPFTEYSNVPELPSVKTMLAVPTDVATTSVGSNGTLANDGPVVRYSVPAYVFVDVSAVFGAVKLSHIGVRSTSYVNHVPKTMSPSCARLKPHPGSAHDGAAHHMS